jgi:hypothetical protein
MADELTPRYSMKRMRDEIARAKEYARREALEEAAKVAERLGSHLVRGESGPEYVGGNLDVAAAIRSLSVAKEPDHD